MSNDRQEITEYSLVEAIYLLFLYLHGSENHYESWAEPFPPRGSRSSWQNKNTFVDMESWINLQYDILDDLENKGLIRQPQKGSSRKGRTYALLNKKGMSAARNILEKLDINGAEEALKSRQHHEEYIKHKNKIELQAEEANSEDDFET
ncbi:MAG: hypothetical protein HC939_20800 [Pleurocapsa sp. SU_5_0]|nr:hypothetical protein [Pleurocapsa sp. SU_5_0]